MKILAITDVHQNLLAAQSAGINESPDLILDCGDHTTLTNLFDEKPHFYIHGNHEPDSISLKQSEALLPAYIPNGSLIQFSDGKNRVTFTGVDGNYGAKHSLFQVNPFAIERLKTIEPNQLDILLVHESPLNVPQKAKGYALAKLLMEQIDRLQPKIVLSGHTNIFSEYINQKQVRYINLDDMCCGYGIIEVEENKFRFMRKQVSWGK